MKDNVLHMPERSRFLKIKNTLRQKFNGEHRKVLASASILSILLMVAIINGRYVSQNQTAQIERGLASVENPHLVQVENNLVARLSEPSEDSGITFADQATELDQLDYGTLEGKYALKLYHGGIQQISLAQNQQTPTLIENREKFLKDNRQFLKIPFQEAVRVRTQVENGQLIEEFTLLDRDEKSLASVQFELDTFGRLLSMKVSQ